MNIKFCVLVLKSYKMKTLTITNRYIQFTCLLFLLIFFNSCMSKKKCELDKIDKNDIAFFEKRKNLVFVNNLGKTDTIYFKSSSEEFVDYSENTVLKKLDCQHYIDYDYEFNSENIYFMFKKLTDKEIIIISTHNVSIYETINIKRKVSKIFKSTDKVSTDEISEIELKNSELIKFKTGDGLIWTLVE